MALPLAFYAEPRFDAESSSFAQLKEAKKLAPDSPGASLALALDYYRVEAFATRSDRDAACGPTAHEDIMYFSVERDELVSKGCRLIDVSCGYGLDHPTFERILTPIFDVVLQRLVGDMIAVPKRRNGVVASAIMSIARTGYKVDVVRKGDWFKFDVDALCLFEQSDPDQMDRTVEFLDGRLRLQLSPSLVNAPCN